MKVGAKLLIEVMAGMFPGEADPQYTKRWAWSSIEQENLVKGDPAAKDRYIRIAGESREYAASLENPAVLNWVRRDWIWL